MGRHGWYNKGKLTVEDKHPEDHEDITDLWELYEYLLCNSEFGLYTGEDLFVMTLSSKGRSLIHPLYNPTYSVDKKINLFYRRYLSKIDHYLDDWFDTGKPLVVAPGYYLADLQVTDQGVITRVHALFTTKNPWALNEGKCVWWGYEVPEEWRIQNDN